MSVDHQHSKYAAAAPKVRRCRDAVEGQDAVHEAGELYLPRLKDQTDQDYKAYVQRASYFNATGRTLEGLVGMVFRKAPEIIAPAAMQAIVDDIDLAGCTLSGLAIEIVEEVLEAGRVGVLVEYPQVIEQPLNQAQAAAQNLRPYATVYEHESIINWKVARVNNTMQPVLVVLTEEVETGGDGFEDKCEKQIRALQLTEQGYQQQLYRKNSKGEWVEFEAPIIPLMNGKPLPFIPFYPFAAGENELNCEEPPILDLADLNLAHYRVSADYEHGCHFTGLPMLFIAGVTLGENEKVSVGSQTALVTDNPQADGKFIEFSGQGLGALEKNLDRKEKQMAAIGARMLESQKSGVESQGAMEMRSNGESSVLASLANTISRGMSAMLAFMAQWEGVAGECSIKLNTDYLPSGMTPQELTALMAAWQSGAISKQTLFENLKRGEIVAETRTYDDEEELIAQGTPLGAV